MDGWIMVSGIRGRENLLAMFHLQAQVLPSPLSIEGSSVNNFRMHIKLEDVYRNYFPEIAEGVFEGAIGVVIQYLNTKLSPFSKLYLYLRINGLVLSIYVFGS